MMECCIADISPSKLARIIIHVLEMKKLECKSTASKAILDAAIRILLSEDDCSIFRNGFDSDVTNSISKALSKPERFHHKDVDDRKTNGISTDQEMDSQKRPHPETPLCSGNISNKQPRKEGQWVISKPKEIPGTLLSQEFSSKNIPLLPLPKDTNPLSEQDLPIQTIQTGRKVLLPFPPLQHKWTDANNATSRKENHYQTFYYPHPNLRKVYSVSPNESYCFTSVTRDNCMSRGYDLYKK